MSRSKNRIQDLLKIFTNGQATDEEEQELFNLIKIEKHEAIIKNHIKKLLSEHKSNDEVPVADWELLYKKINKEKHKEHTDSKIRRISWSGWAAAAAIILLLGTGYYFFTYTGQKQNEVAKIEQAEVNDVAPPNTINAVLTLSNGQRIVLDSSGNGMIAAQGAVNVIKLSNGQIAYRGSSKDIQYNTLNNPRGSRVISLMLADGSKVWLNAASSLTYPTAFVGNERKVEVTGEAYFEVAHNPDKPFIVSKAGTSIKVLGTHFNVNAYDDESSLDVTLLKGSVSVMDNHSMHPEVIKPGTQAQVKKNGNIQLDNSVDLNEVMAWKNGLFSFKGSDIQSIMRQVTRWYDVDVIYKEPIKEKFYAEVSKSTNVSTLLEMLQATKAVRFKIEGNTITVTP